jgi:arsenate reductase (thioredoxin)
MTHTWQSFLTLMVALGVCALAPGRAPAGDSSEDTIVMVCEHGSVKSLMAASLFNRRATARGLPFRAVSRGVNPDAAVPKAIAAALERDGFDVSHFVPTLASAGDLTKARRVVAIGVDLASIAPAAAPVVRHWDDVPAASLDYAAARAALEKHIEALLDELAGTL